MKINSLIFLFLSIGFLFSCDKKEDEIGAKNTDKSNFVIAKEGGFYRNGLPYRYIGTNYWYGALLGAEKGNRKRLVKELDELKALGMVNVRVAIGAEGGSQDFSVREALQPKQGEFREELLVGLDFILAELAKRDMTAILYFSNNWEWSGGFAQYLEWNGYGTYPNPNLEEFSWPEFMEYTSKFYACEACTTALENYAKKIITRTNTITKEKYTDDTAIMAWEVANEPRVFTPENEKVFTHWLDEFTGYIKSLDSNHLVTSGSEGKAGSNDDIDTFERTHQSKNIDYITMHIWSKNWGWYDAEDEENSTQTSIKNMLSYVDEHIKVAKSLHKPLVLEEFGFPRSKESLDRKASSLYRDQFYKASFDRFIQAIEKNEPLAAINIWGYGGLAKNNPEDGKWKIGVDYTTDPPQEPQGLNSVFSGESTLELIKEYNQKIKQE